MVSTTLVANDSTEKLKIVIELKSQKNAIPLSIVFANQTKSDMYIREDSVGFIEFRNLINRYIVLDENGEKLGYNGIKDHTSDVIHTISPGKSLKVIHDISRIYDFQSIKGPITIQYKYEYLDRKFQTVTTLSNRVFYSGPSVKLKSRF
jgi:hypothetical protein